MNNIKKLLLNQGATKTIEGVPPLTLERSLGKDLKDYKIYGKSQQGKNLLTYPYVHTTKTEGGLTYTDNGDGSITIQGTATASSYFTINRGLDLGSEHISETVGTNGEYALSKKLRYNANIQAVSIEFKAGTVVDETFYPQAEKGTVSTEYQQPSYFVSPEKPMEIESVGDKTVNLADMSKTTNENFVDNGDGSFTLTKMSNSKRFSEEIFPNIPANTTFYIKAKILEYTGTYSQKLQLLVHLEDGSTKYINNAADDIQGKYTYTSAVKDIRIYSDGSNPDGTIVTFKDFIISTEDVPYEPYGKYKIPVVSRGKNLCNPYGFADFGTYYLMQKFMADNKTDNYYISLVDKNNGEDITGCYFGFCHSTNVEAGGYRWMINNGEVRTLESSNITTSGVTNYGNYLLVYPKTQETVNKLFARFDIQLEKGTKNTGYNSYVEPKQTNIFLKEPLHKLGNYADYIDFENKKIVRNIKEVLFDGSDDENWRIQSTNSYGIANFHTSIVGDILSTQFISNRFKRQSTQIASTQTEGMLHANAITFYFRLKSERASTVAELKEWLKNNNTSLVAISSTPIEEPIELPNIPTHKGTTVIELDTKINASNMQAKYKRR